MEGKQALQRALAAGVAAANSPDVGSEASFEEGSLSLSLSDFSITLKTINLATKVHTTMHERRGRSEFKTRTADRKRAQRKSCSGCAVQREPPPSPVNNSSLRHGAKSARKTSNTFKPAALHAIDYTHTHTQDARF